MTVIGLLLLAIAILVIGSLAYWVIIKFIPAEYKTLALASVGIIILLVLGLVLVPGILNQRIW